MSVPIRYTWAGESITDIHAWTRERGEKMVRARKTWDEPNVYAGRFIKREEIMEMPAAFFDCLRFGGPHNELYTEIERYDP